jgi:NADPH:quinone reductase-like Zn-dependent oxidoreductase
MTMRAVSQDRFGDPEVLKLIELPKPAPLPTEVLVRVHAAGINPVDTKTRAGGGMAGVLGDPPFVLGWDVSGVVEEVGFGVHTLAVGDEVYGMPWFPRQAGGYAEYMTAPSRQFARKPTTLTHEQAAAVPLAGLTAWQVLTAAADVQAGQRVLVNGAAGGVGHFAVQFAKHLGAEVIGTARASKHEWLKSLGADQVIDYTTDHFEDVVKDIDLVVDLIGAGTRSLQVVKPGGLVVFVPSAAAKEIAETAEAAGVRVIPYLVEPDGPALTEIAQLIDAGAVQVEVEKVFGLDQADEAHRALESGRTRGKIVLKVV